MSLIINSYQEFNSTRITTINKPIHNHLSSSPNTIFYITGMDSTMAAAMASQPQPEETVLHLPPFVTIYKSGRVERLMGTLIAPASTDPSTGVQSRDVVFSPENNLSARLYLPPPSAEKENPDKLPLLVYFHGGGFVIETPYSPAYHNYLNKLVADANVVAVSVDYRRAPEHFLPVAYEDSWEALRWVSAHAGGGGDEKWLRDYVDFDRVFMAGDSAGANIAHNMAMRAGSEKLNGVIFQGIILVHAYFWGKDPIGNEAKDLKKKDGVDKLWLFVSPSSTNGNDDPFINPLADTSKLSGLGCTRVLVCVAEKDVLRDRNWGYYEALKKCGWSGQAEIFPTEGEDHVFHLFNPACANAGILMKKVVSFMKGAGA